MTKADLTLLEPSVGETKPAGQITLGSCSPLSPNRVFGTLPAPPSPTSRLRAEPTLLALMPYLNSLLITEVQTVGFPPRALGDPGACPRSRCLFAQGLPGLQGRRPKGDDEVLPPAWAGC